MRTTSLTLRNALFAQETGEVPVVLLTIAHPALAAPIRLSSDPTQRFSTQPLQYGTVSRGVQFLFFPFSITLPDDVGERAPVAQIVVDNVDRLLTRLMRTTSVGASVGIEIVLAGTPNAVEIDYPSFTLQGVVFDATSMTLQLGLDALADEPFPAGSFDPSGFPGLF